MNVWFLVWLLIHGWFLFGDGVCFIVVHCLMCVSFFDSRMSSLFLCMLCDVLFARSVVGCCVFDVCEFMCVVCCSMLVVFGCVCSVCRVVCFVLSVI